MSPCTRHIALKFTAVTFQMKGLIERYLKWCNNNHLKRHTSRTTELDCNASSTEDVTLKSECLAGHRLFFSTSSFPNSVLPVQYLTKDKKSSLLLSSLTFGDKMLIHWWVWAVITNRKCLHFTAIFSQILSKFYLKSLQLGKTLTEALKLIT